MPLYFQTILKVSPLISGLSLVPAAALLSVLNPRAGKMLDAFGPRRVVMIGMSLIVVGFVGLTLLAGHLPLWLAIVWAMVVEAGNAFVMMPAVTTGANALPKALLSDGTAVTTTARQLLGSLGVAMATVILQQVQTVTGQPIAGFRATFFVFAIVGLCGWLLSLRLPKQQRA
jgi:MFS family permease